MKKTAKIIISLIFVIAVVASVCMPIFAQEAPFKSYTYSYAGEYQESPNPYNPQNEIFLFGGESLNQPEDLIVVGDKIIIADTANNRIVILNEDFSVNKIIKNFSCAINAEETFSSPSGVFVDAKGNLYVADTEKARIVKFNSDYLCVSIFEAPKANVLPDGFVYKPQSVAVDQFDRMYIVSKNTNMGVIAMSQTGEFEGFIGAQRVQPNLIDLFWRTFKTPEQIKRSVKNVPMTYSNIAIDESGFVFVTGSSMEPAALYQTIKTRSTDSTYAPIKKLNPFGKDVLNRNGFFPPVGDINFDQYAKKGSKAPSSIDEISLQKNGVYSLVDSKYNKIFTYDSVGNLLYAFGGSGDSSGLFHTLKAVAYKGDTLLALDKGRSSITTFKKTQYGMLLDEVIALQSDRKYSQTIPVWETIISQNNNCDLAYIGIGKALVEQKEYKKAKDYFKAVYDKEYYSKALKLQRTAFLNKYALLVGIGFLLIIYLTFTFFGFAKKYNKKHAPYKEKRTLREELMYAFHIIFHPFDGFWDVKHEKRGSAKAATVILAVTTFVFIAKDFLSGYLFSDIIKPPFVFSSALNVLLPFVLWCIANWCLTSLMNGKGSMKDIYIMTSYSLVPIILLYIPAIIASNFMILDEGAFIQFATAGALIWSGLLLFFGTVVTHDYTIGKNVFVIILTIIGIMIILFLLLLFFNVTGRMTTFIQNIFKELTFRL